MTARLLSRAMIPALFAMLVLGAASVASACPSCQAALDGDASHGDLVSGLFYSILFMMSMPFAIVGVFVGMAYRAVKREQRRREAEEAEGSSQDAGSAE